MSLSSQKEQILYLLFLDIHIISQNTKQNGRADGQQVLYAYTQTIIIMIIIVFITHFWKANIKENIWSCQYWQYIIIIIIIIYYNWVVTRWQWLFYM